MTLVRSPTISGRLLSSASTSFDARVVSAVLRGFDLARFPAFGHLRDGGDVFVGGAAAAADDIEPALRRSGRAARRAIAGVSRYRPSVVGQSGVGIAGDAGGGHIARGCGYGPS